MSSAYIYQLALNYRLQEKVLYDYSFEDVEILGNSKVFDLGENTALQVKGIDIITVYYFTEEGEQIFFEDDDIVYDNGQVTLKNLIDTPPEGYGFINGDTPTIYISLGTNLHNKYQFGHEFTYNYIKEKTRKN